MKISTRSGSIAVLAAAVASLVIQGTTSAQVVAQPPAGHPPGAAWVQGRAGGGPVQTGATFTQYAYPTLSQLPYKANPGAAATAIGAGLGAAFTAAGQPAAGAIAIGAAALVSQNQQATADKGPRPDMAPVITERASVGGAQVARIVGSPPPVVQGFGGGGIMPASGCHPFCNKPK